MFLAPCWLGWSMVRAGRASRRTALEPGRGGGGGEEMLSTVASLCYGAEHYFRHTLHTIPATATATSHCCTHFSELYVRSHHRSGAAETVLTNQWTVTLVSDTAVKQTTWPVASPLWLCCTWHQQWPALKPWWRLKELWHIAAELQLEKTEPKQWRREDSSSYEEEWREQWMSSLKGGVKNVLQPHHCLEIEARLAI